jgi:Cobalt uptake substrate-specific transmembrane region
MHIEAGVVGPDKIWLSYITAAAVLGYLARISLTAMRQNGVAAFLGRSVACTALVFSFFEVLPHYPVGVSEVHFILGSTLFLLFGAAASGVGLVLGLLTQSLFFAPTDLPQYGMNITTLLVPLFGLMAVAKRVIAPQTPYVQLGYGQTLALSSAYQAGIVTWVAFWAFYGHGFTAANMANVTAFSGAYLLVILAEPLIDLAVLAGAKTLHKLRGHKVFEQRLFNAA